MREQLPGGGIELSPAEIEALGARWSSCWTPSEVAHVLTGIAAPWYVAAGWALDLFRGAQTTVPQLTATQHATLAELLARVHPEHHWLASL